MKRRLSIRARLERLEAAIAGKAPPLYREAFILIDADVTGERHLAMLSPEEQARCYFQEMPGPGPQLVDFGKFSTVVAFTPDEWDA